MVRKKTTRTADDDATPLLEKGSTRKRLSNAGDSDHATKKQKSEIVERTDYSRWRLRDDHSRHTWHYLEDDEEAEKWPQTTTDKYFLGLPLVSAFLSCDPCSVRKSLTESAPPGSARTAQG